MFLTIVTLFAAPVFFWRHFGVVACLAWPSAFVLTVMEVVDLLLAVPV